MLITFIVSLFCADSFATPCADGWQSPSTGRGTCSHHGGIDHGSYYIPPVLLQPVSKKFEAPKQPVFFIDENQKAENEKQLQDLAAYVESEDEIRLQQEHNAIVLYQEEKARLQDEAERAEESNRHRPVSMIVAALPALIVFLL